MPRLIAALAAAFALTITAAPADALGTVAPVAGDCHNYTLAQMQQVSDTSPVVACNTKHTAKVVKVFQLPAGVDWTLTQAALDKLIESNCRPAYNKILGRDLLGRLLSPYNMGAFTPTQAERDAGARWVRCDVFMWGGKTSLAPLPFNAAPMIPKPLTKKAQRCLVGTNFYVTVCTRTHQWKATGDFNVRQGPYPTATQMSKFAVKGCTPKVTSRQFRYTAPSQKAWKTGFRAIVCYSKTTN